MMKISGYIIPAVMIMTAGCKGYIGGIDDADIKETQLVMVNRSSHEIAAIISDSDIISPEDTIFLEPGNGLWKYTKECEHYDLHFDSDIMTLIFDGKRKISIDRGLFHPNLVGSVSLSDSRRIYNVYDFTDDFCNEIFRQHDILKTFRMSNVPPSVIDTDSVKVRGSSEGWFKNIYPVPEIREKLKIGRVVSKEAESLAKIAFEADPSPEYKDPVFQQYDDTGFRCSAQYYSIEMLRKIGLAHFGCDFASLTGRDSEEMDRFAGIVISRIYNSHIETLEVAEDSIEGLQEGTAVISQISYGNVMFLLVEGDFNPDYPEAAIENATDFHLITLDAEGKFRCESGGKEKLAAFIDVSSDQPVFPILFSVSDFGPGIDAIHIPDIQ